MAVLSKYVLRFNLTLVADGAAEEIRNRVSSRCKSLRVMVMIFFGLFVSQQALGCWESLLVKQLVFYFFSGEK